MNFQFFLNLKDKCNLAVLCPEILHINKANKFLNIRNFSL